MKKTICRLLAIVLSFLFAFQSSLVAFADDEPDWQDASWTQEEFNDILSQNPDNQISAYASGLVLSYAIAISSSGSNLLVAGKTLCHPDVVKCGFTEVTIKRRVNDKASWTTYKTYKDLYISNSSYVLTKTVPVAKGYQYKVDCTHYAKKSIFSTEKITNSSNVVAL